MSKRFSNRTRYTPLWDTWCDTCREGVSPDHERRCVYCGTATRRNHHANRDHPNRYPGTPPELFDAARRALRGGIPLREFARAALAHTNYNSADSLSRTIASEFHRRGWPTIGSAEASRLAKRRYAQRLAIGERPDRLCAGVNRAGKPCSRCSAAGSVYCNLHHPDTGADALRRYTENVRASVVARAERGTPFSHYADRVVAWQEAYGYGALRAAETRVGINFGSLRSLLTDHRRGVDRVLTSRTEALIVAMLDTPPHPLPGDRPNANVRRNVA